MKYSTLFQVAREGWFILAPLLVLLPLAHTFIGTWASIVVLVAIALVALFFHDHARPIVADPLAVTSPVDGIILRQTRCHDPFLNRKALKTSIQVNLFGAYYLRAPVAGTALEIDNANQRCNVRSASYIRMDSGEDIVMTVRKGFLLGSRPCQGNFGERIGQGRCCGVRRLAKQIDLYYPEDARALTKKGQTIRAGKDILAKLAYTE